MFLRAHRGGQNDYTSYASFYLPQKHQMLSLSSSISLFYIYLLQKYKKKSQFCSTVSLQAPPPWYFPNRVPRLGDSGRSRRNTPEVIPAYAHVPLASSMAPTRTAPSNSRIVQTQPSSRPAPLFAEEPQPSYVQVNGFAIAQSMFFVPYAIIGCYCYLK